MIECAKCGKKLGFFSSKHDYEDSKGNSLKYCDDCHEREEEKERKIIEKGQAELKKKVLPMIINFISNSPLGYPPTHLLRIIILYIK